MELKEFIKETISSISDAIYELNEEKTENGLIVNPSKIKWKGETNDLYEDGRIIKNIEFNLSVQASDKNGTGVGLKINIVNAGIGNEKTNSTISTIKFSIPVAFPLQK
ncbi:trypco2 family protein [Bacteroides thetaiotaomicron]|jgi:hypothetical protein|uniref:trypco2 family protein n=1 Tax=Bacteroides thetaiotaomicron TaxID=818 RepID=UPI0039C0CD06